MRDNKFFELELRALFKTATKAERLQLMAEMLTNQSRFDEYMQFRFVLSNLVASAALKPPVFSNELTPAEEAHLLTEVKKSQEKPEKMPEHVRQRLLENLRRARDRQNFAE